MKKIILAVIAAAACVTFFTSFNTKPNPGSKGDYVVMSISEVRGDTLDLVVSYGNGKPELTRLAKNGMTIEQRQAEAITTFLNKMKKGGYKLKAAYGEIDFGCVLEKE